MKKVAKLRFQGVVKLEVEVSANTCGIFDYTEEANPVVNKWSLRAHCSAL